MQTIRIYDGPFVLSKKRYCIHCGKLLKKRVKEQKVISEGDPEYDGYVRNRYKPFMQGDVSIERYFVYCEDCGYETTIQTHDFYAEIQKQKKRSILTEDELAEVDRILLKEAIKEKEERERGQKQGKIAKIVARILCAIIGILFLLKKVFGVF